MFCVHPPQGIDHHTELMCFQVEYEYDPLLFLGIPCRGEWGVCVSEFFLQFFAHIHPLALLPQGATDPRPTLLTSSSATGGTT